MTAYLNAYKWPEQPDKPTTNHRIVIVPYPVATATQDRMCQSVLSGGEPVHLLGKLRRVLVDIIKAQSKAIASLRFPTAPDKFVAYELVGSE